MTLNARCSLSSSFSCRILETGKIVPKNPLLDYEQCWSKEALKAQPLLLLAVKAVTKKKKQTIVGDVKWVQLLLMAGADPNIREKLTQQTPLMMAAWNNNAAVCKALLEGGPGGPDYPKHMKRRADASLVDSHEWNACHVASFKGWGLLYNEVLEPSKVGVDPDAETETGHRCCDFIEMMWSKAGWPDTAGWRAEQARLAGEAAERPDSAGTITRKAKEEQARIEFANKRAVNKNKERTKTPPGFKSRSSGDKTKVAAAAEEETNEEGAAAAAAAAPAGGQDGGGDHSETVPSGFGGLFAASDEEKEETELKEEKLPAAAGAEAE